VTLFFQIGIGGPLALAIPDEWFLERMPDAVLYDRVRKTLDAALADALAASALPRTGYRCFIGSAN